MKKTQINKRIAQMIANAEVDIKEAQNRHAKALQQQDQVSALLALVPDSVKYVSVYPSSIDYTWQVKGFNSAKTKKLLEAYMLLDATLGMRCEMSSDDNPDYNTRTFRFMYFFADNDSSWNADLSVLIGCELIEGGTACRRVQVGERVETVRTPEYKFICK